MRKVQIQRHAHINTDIFTTCPQYSAHPDNTEKSEAQAHSDTSPNGHGSGETEDRATLCTVALKVSPPGGKSGRACIQISNSSLMSCLMSV